MKSVKMSSISGWTCSPLFKYNATFLLGDHHQSHHHMNYPSIFYSQSNNKLIFKLYDNAPRYHLPSPPCKRRQSLKRCLSSNVTFLRFCLKPFCFRWFVWISARVTRIEPLMSQKNESASEISTETKRTGIKLYRSQPLKISRWHPRQRRYLVTVDFCYPSWKRWSVTSRRVKICLLTNISLQLCITMCPVSDSYANCWEYKWPMKFIFSECRIWCQQ